MSEKLKNRMPMLFSLLVAVAALFLFGGVSLVGASDDHDTARLMRSEGNIMPLRELLQHPALVDQRVLEAELERENGKLVYELELLDPSGRVTERYFDATTGQPLDYR